MEASSIMAMMITMEEGVMAMEINVTMEMATTMIQMTILFTILYDYMLVMFIFLSYYS
jgi:hypothetical protein